MKLAMGVAEHQTGLAHDFMPTRTVNRTYGRQLTGGVAKTIDRIQQETRATLAETQRNYATTVDNTQKASYLSDDDDNDVMYLGDNDDSTEGSLSDFRLDDDVSVGESGGKAGVIPQNAGQIPPHLGQHFQVYIRHARRSFQNFTKSQRRAIRLLVRLRKTKASLDTYESIMEWHFREIGKINVRQSVAQCAGFISRAKMFKFLRKRYNLASESYGNIAQLSLPHSKAKVNIVWNDAQTAIISLLTDPRIRDKDYLFWGDDPLAPPPAAPDFVKDLNTGTSYTQTYKDLITKPGKQVLLPVIFYIDGANTGQFSDLPITAVKISLGIFTRKARDKEHLWRTIGYIPAISKHKSRGRRIVLDSNHMDGIMAHPDALDGEGIEVDNSIPKAQDLHTMLAKILVSYVKLQESGFRWDLHYKKNVYPDIEFVLYTPFLKLDGDEAEKLCGKYTSRGANVAQLCRYCECPTDESDDPLANYPYKTKAKILGLTDAEATEALQAMSQQLIRNATYVLRFGTQTLRSIHGACPMEMLHAMLLGIFKYVRDCLFAQLGPTSQLAADFNALAQMYGDLLSRQSDRDLPKTRFNQGIVRGKLMAKEFPGILLCIAAVLRSTEGTKLLLRKKPGTFAQPGVLADWRLLVETLLQWEMWLKSDKMSRNHVQFAQYKHRHLMHIIKKVGRRATGMGLKISKFHAISHMADDILQYGVPMEYDTGSNESGHKATKVAARLTQKNAETFDQQTATRLEEVHLLELAEEELAGNCLWNYGQHPNIPDKEGPNLKKARIGGSKILVYYDDQSDEYLAADTSRSKSKKAMTLEKALIDFVADLQLKVSQYLPSVPIRTEYSRDGQIFRANSQYRGHVWRDWVIVDWGEEGHLANKIWGFLDLRELPQDSLLSHGGIDLQPGIFAVVENSVVSRDQDALDMSELFVPIAMEVGGLTLNNVSHLSFYLADVEAFVKPVAVIPDIGGQRNGYFLLRERASWKEMFEQWLESPRVDGEMED